MRLAGGMEPSGRRRASPCRCPRPSRLLLGIVGFGDPQPGTRLGHGRCGYGLACPLACGRGEAGQFQHAAPYPYRPACPGPEDTAVPNQVALKILRRHAVESSEPVVQVPVQPLNAGHRLVPSVLERRPEPPASIRQLHVAKGAQLCPRLNEGRQGCLYRSHRRLTAVDDHRCLLPVVGQQEHAGGLSINEAPVPAQGYPAPGTWPVRRSAAFFGVRDISLSNCNTAPKGRPRPEAELPDDTVAPAKGSGWGDLESTSHFTHGETQPQAFGLLVPLGALLYVVQRGSGMGAESDAASVALVTLPACAILPSVEPELSDVAAAALRTGRRPLFAWGQLRGGWIGRKGETGTGTRHEGATSRVGR